MIRTAATSTDSKKYKRPRTVYTSSEEGAYWKGNDKTVTSTPVFFQKTGSVGGADLAKYLGVEEITPDQITIVRNGATASKPKSTNISLDSTKNHTFTGNGIRLEVYHAADTGKYTFIHLWYTPWKITDVTPATYYADGTVDKKGSVTFDNGKSLKTNDFTKDDIGTYALTYSTGSSISKITTPVEVFRSEIVTGKLEKHSEKTGLTIDGREYLYPYRVPDNSGMKTYIKDGGAIGDTVNLLVSDDGYAVALWK